MGAIPPAVATPAPAPPEALDADSQVAVRVQSSLSMHALATSAATNDIDPSIIQPTRFIRRG